jgi:hypothetical protein
VTDSRRRKLFELADIASKARNQKKRITISPIAFEAVQKFDAIFELERSISGSSPEARLGARRKEVAPRVNDLIEWMNRERDKLSPHNEVAKAMNCMLKRIEVFTRFLEDGRICLSNNAAERKGTAFQEAAIAAVAYSSGPTDIIAFALILWGLRTPAIESSGRPPQRPDDRCPRE